MKPIKHITIVTGTRAEYGILKPVIAAIDKHKSLKLQLIVTGQHLIKRFGYTANDIINDKCRIDKMIPMQTASDDPFKQAQGLGSAITKMAKTFKEINTDIVLVLGDRIEVFGAATAAIASNLILAHIHGGDVAPGIQDDSYRHAITKLAHLHFAATPGAAKRIAKMGEEPWRIATTGSPSIDGLSGLIVRNTTSLNKYTGINTREGFLIVMQHPSGGSLALEKEQMDQTLHGCLKCGLKIVILSSNSDSGFSGISQSIKQFQKKHACHVITHLPREVFIGLLTRAKVMVGNSSAGIIESSRLNVDIINVGKRQAGRERAGNVVDVDYGSQHIEKALKKILSARYKCKVDKTLYGDGRSANRIASALAKCEINRTLWQKRIVY